MRAATRERTRTSVVSQNVLVQQSERGAMLLDRLARRPELLQRGAEVVVQHHAQAPVVGQRRGGAVPARARATRQRRALSAA